jgi:hypothetical protein
LFIETHQACIDPAQAIGFHHQIIYFTVAKLMEVGVLKMAMITRESPLDRAGH